MSIECTLSIIKPDSVSKNIIGVILNRFENDGLRIIGSKMLRLTQEQVRAFYSNHKKKSFFNNLVQFMISGPIVVSVLERENAIQHHRDLIGATNPSQALPGTLRADYGESITKNAIHGSDCTKSAAREIMYFFNEDEIYF